MARFSTPFLPLPTEQRVSIYKIESAEDTADLMFCLHGFRRSIISDCDPRLTSEWWNLLCSKLGVLHMDSTAYQPQTNGRAERINQTMKQLLCGAHFNGDNWYDALPLAKMANNNAPLLLSQLRLSPFQCMPRSLCGLRPCMKRRIKLSQLRLWLGSYAGFMKAR